MQSVERSFSDVLQDIVRNLQDIIRSEVRLAKTEVQEELTKARSGALMLSGGALAGIFGIFFVLLAAVYGLAYVVPNWFAALIVASILAVGAGAAIRSGLRQVKRVNPAPKTIESLKENVEWAKQRVK